MEIELEDDAPQGWTLLCASGEVDVTSVAALDDALADLLASDRTRVIVDLDQVDFIDSAGLEVVVDAAERARASDGDVRLVCSNSRLLRVLSIARVDDGLVVADSADDVAAAAPAGSR